MGKPGGTSPFVYEACIKTANSENDVDAVEELEGMAKVGHLDESFLRAMIAGEYEPDDEDPNLAALAKLA